MRATARGARTREPRPGTSCRGPSHTAPRLSLRSSQSYREQAQNVRPADGVPAAQVAAGQRAIPGQFLLGELLPAAVLDLDPGQRGAEGGEGQLDLGHRRGEVPRHDEPDGRLPDEHLAPVELGAVLPGLEDPATRAPLEGHVPDLILPGRERSDRPPDADGVHERVEGVPLVAADQYRLPDRWPTQRRHRPRYPALVVLCHTRTLSISPAIL